MSLHDAPVCKPTKSQETMTITVPTVLWAQRKDKSLVSIQLEDVTEEEISVDDNKLTFSGKSSGKTYAVDLEFFEDIVPQESRQRKGGREYFFELKKKTEGFWPRLLKDKKKHANIKVDFNRWKDEDDSDEEAGMYDDANLQDMMQQMGTGGGSFDPGEALDDSEDSDDEDIPDLEDDTGSKKK